ncbi:MAG: SusC/RagA family TonB-linked outer membrane protein [Paludibacteraceae bacterium]
MKPVKSKAYVLISLLILTNFAFAKEYENASSSQSLKYNSTESAQNVQSNRKSVNGQILDANNLPIIGASVVEEGTTNGVVTDFDGNFKLNVNENGKLVISYVGYTSQTIPVQGETFFRVNLEENFKNLDELVVIGYGVVKKSDLTGAVGSIKSNDITKIASSNALQAVQGKVTGIDIQQTSGQAGAGISINLRGNRSITASNSPLILVDGTEYGSTIDINPSDIESIEVLKDASSTAIYGTRGANGVIIITTKRGKAGATKVTFNTYLSSNSPVNIPKVMYGDKEVQRLIDKSNYQADKASGNWGTSNLTPEQVLTEKLEDFTEIGIYNDKSYTNWLDIILQNGMTKNIETSVSGGNDKTNFSLSLGSMFEEGLMKNDKQNRYNVKTTIDHRINKYFKTGSSILFTYKDRNARNASVFSQAMKMTTITHAYRADGSIIETPNPRYAAHSNPLLDEIEGNYVNNIENTRFFGNGYLEINPVKNMVFKTNLTVDRFNEREGLYQDYQSVARYQAPATSYISSEYGNNTKYTWENTLTYNTDFGKSKHNLTTLLGHSMNQSVYESTHTYGDAGKEHYYKSLFYDLSRIGTATTETGYIKQSMLSYFGRINYKYDEKYLLTASIRADGSSTLAPGHKWGYFPSIAAAWRASEESFLKDVNWLNNLKFRASWGVSGNAAVPAYKTMSTLSALPVYYYLGAKDVSGNYPSVLGNSSLKWETTQAANFGLDFGVLDVRVSGSVDIFFSHTFDLLYPKSAPPSSVYPSVISNIGETTAQGLEVSLYTLLAKNRVFSWDINWSYTTFKDKVVALSEGITQNLIGTGGQIVGQPISIYYDYKTEGNWGAGEYAQFVTDWTATHTGQTLAYPAGYGEPGTLRIIDRNNDGKLNDADKFVYNRSPKHIFGMNNNISIKDFNLSIFALARLGSTIAYDMNTQLNYESANWGDLDYWTPTNVNAKFPSPGAPSSIFASYGTALRYEKADYLKIKDITLSYNLPNNLIRSINLTKLQVFGSLKNYFTFSNIDNYDPERDGAISFPLAKQLVFGLNIEL